MLHDSDAVNGIKAAPNVRKFKSSVLAPAPAGDEVFNGFRAGAFPVAEDVASRLLSIPLFPEMTDEQVDEVVAALEECVPTQSHVTA